jgi:hypothetical protein
LKTFRFAVLSIVVLAALQAYSQQGTPAGTDKSGAQTEATPQQAQTPAPAPLPTPSTAGPLQLSPPYTFEAGPLGKLAINGAVSGMGLFQNNAVSSNNPQEGAFTNAFIFFQKPEGWFQFYVQAGAYDIPALGSAFISNASTNDNLYGPVPVAFGKLVWKNTNIVFGILPTLIGAESTFSFQNMNIERGLLWNQENAITRGVQVNQTFNKHFNASLSYNDGFYSNRYNWLSGALTYASTNSTHSVAFTAGGNLGSTNWQSLATPIQNNSMIFDLIYTFSKNGWVVQPYVQYTDVPTNPKANIPQGAHTWGGAILASRTLKKGFSLAGRWEYIGSSGNLASNSANLLYGPGSAAWSITATPTYQYKKFFTRTDISYVSAGNITPGTAFGTLGLKPTQTRGVIEVGLLF